MSKLRQGWNSHRVDGLCLMVIAMLATLFMHRWLRPGYTSLPLNLESAILPWHGQVFEPPQNLLISDPFYIFYPARLYLTESLRQGTLPLWNPYILGGHPVQGDTTVPSFYPFNLLAALVLPAARALPLLAWLHLILSGAWMYVFLRVMALRPLAALLGSVTWMLCEFTVVWLNAPHFLSTLAWMPGMFACFEIAVQRKNARWAVVGGVAFGLETLGGQIQMALYSALLLGAYAVFHILHRSWKQRQLDVWPGLALALIGGVGIGVGAVQLFPAYQLAGLSHRTLWSLEQLLATRWPLRHVVTLWLPDFWGNALRNNYRSNFNFAETAAYFGVVPAVLGGMSLFVNRRWTNWFASGLFLLTLLVAGGTGVVAGLMWLPGLRYFNLSRLAGLLAFPGAILAANAVEALGHCPTRLRMSGLAAALALMAVVTAGLAAADPQDVTQHWSIIRADLIRTLLLVGLAALAVAIMTRWPRAGLVGLMGLTFADLYQWGEPFNPVHPINILYPPNQVVDVLKQDSSLYRTLPLKSSQTVFGPNVISVFGIAEVGGYTSLTVGRYQELLRAMDPQVQTGNMVTSRQFQPLYGMLNVRYVLSPKELPSVITLARHEGCARQTAPLAGSAYFDQSFVASEDGFNRLDVTLARAGQPGDQPVRLRVWRGNAGDELIADLTTSTQDLPDRDWSVFFFAPVPDSKGDRFTWRIEAPDARPDATMSLCLAQDAPERIAAFIAYGVLLQQIEFRQGVWIYENPNVLPRAYIVHHVEVAPRDWAQMLQSPQFNVHRTALLDAPLSADQSAALSPSPIRSCAQASITRYEAQRVDIEAQTAAPGLLVLSDVYYPGWQVSVDGRAAQTLQVNHALRGVYLSAGAHTVSFTFRPTIFYVGLAVTVLTTLLVCAVVRWNILNK